MGRLFVSRWHFDRFAAEYDAFRHVLFVHWVRRNVLLLLVHIVGQDAFGRHPSELNDPVIPFNRSNWPFGRPPSICSVMSQSGGPGWPDPGGFINLPPVDKLCQPSGFKITILATPNGIIDDLLALW